MGTKEYVRILKAPYRSIWYANKIGRIFSSLGTWENAYKVDSPDRALYIRKEDVELIVTEKRKAAVGERVLVTNAITESGAYKTGDICTVWSVYPHGVITVIEHRYYLVAEEYEVIVDSEVENEEADEMENGKTRYDLAVENVREAIEELRLAAYEQGYEDAKRQLNAKDPAVSAQARRDEIVEQAKADIKKLSNCGGAVPHMKDDASGAFCNIEFAVNRDKRTVVALLKGVRSQKVYARGIAKAAPSDCFNVHIGKAIALRRALGLAVSDEYLNAPQPTVVRVGDVVRGKYEESYYRYEGRLFGDSYEEQIKEIEDGKFRYMSGDYDFIDSADLTIIDDSREEVGE
ncbi:hypothetical protein MOB65_18975 [Bacillus inaquosorum]|uniref:hypothetical protein n=1 Tax=Bacillus inaquosorum TaxID=483913 RepID=UPI002282D5A0|nr:hypothetical protein [Bacillus inaquosorum]MCY7910946.1 hypothetical protein [Bacillus inaquosorum]